PSGARQWRAQAPNSPGGPSHVPIPSQSLEASAIGLVLRAPRSLRDVFQLPASQLHDDFVHVASGGLDRRGAGSAAQRAVPFSIALVVVERNGRDALTADVFPDFQLGPIEKRMNADVSSRREIGVELIPKLWGLVLNAPRALVVAR